MSTSSVKYTIDKLVEVDQAVEAVKGSSEPVTDELVERALVTIASLHGLLADHPWRHARPGISI